MDELGMSTTRLERISDYGSIDNDDEVNESVQQRKSHFVFRQSFGFETISFVCKSNIQEI